MCRRLWPSGYYPPCSTDRKVRGKELKGQMLSFLFSSASTNPTPLMDSKQPQDLSQLGRSTSELGTEPVIPVPCYNCWKSTDDPKLREESGTGRKFHPQPRRRKKPSPPSSSHHLFPLQDRRNSVGPKPRIATLKGHCQECPEIVLF